MNPATVVNARQKKKQGKPEKRKKRRGEKAKRNSQDCCITVKLCILSMPKLIRRTCEGLCGMFYLFTALARQWPENGSTRFKTRFSAKSPAVNRLISAPQFWTDYSSYFQSEKNKTKQNKTKWGELVSQQQRQRFIFPYLYLVLTLTNIIIRWESGTSHGP